MPFPKLLEMEFFRSLQKRCPDAEGLVLLGSRFQIKLRQFHIRGRGDFYIARRAHHDRYGQAGAFDQRNLVRAEEPVEGGVLEAFNRMS